MIRYDESVHGTVEYVFFREDQDEEDTQTSEMEGAVPHPNETATVRVLPPGARPILGRRDGDADQIKFVKQYSFCKYCVNLQRAKGWMPREFTKHRPKTIDGKTVCPMLKEAAANWRYDANRRRPVVWQWNNGAPKPMIYVNQEPSTSASNGPSTSVASSNGGGAADSRWASSSQGTQFSSDEAASSLSS